MTYVRRQDEGSVEVLRISNAVLNETLDIADDNRRKLAKQLLQDADLIRPHRRNRGPDVDGYTLPPGWQPEHLGHLAKRGRNLLQEHGHAEQPTRGTILKW